LFHRLSVKIVLEGSYPNAKTCYSIRGEGFHPLQTTYTKKSCNLETSLNIRHEGLCVFNCSLKDHKFSNPYMFYRQQQADLKPGIKMLKKTIQLEQTQVSAFKSGIITTTITTNASLPQTSNNSQSKPTASSSSISSSTSIRKKSIDDMKSNTIINQLATNPLCPQDTKLFQQPTVQREVQRRHSSECGDIGGSLSKTHVQLSGVGINKLVPFRIPKKTSSQTTTGTAGPTQNCKPGPYSSTSASSPAAPKRRRPSEISDLSKANINNNSIPKPHQVKKTISIPATPLPEKVVKRRHSSYGNRRRGPRGDGNELGYSERKHNRHPHQTQRQRVRRLRSWNSRDGRRFR
jgi:hypothetical protein